MGSILFKKINVVDVKQHQILPDMDVLVDGKVISSVASNITDKADRIID